MSRFGRSGEGRKGRVLPTLIKAAVAILLIGWLSLTIIDLERRLRDTNRARDTLARELREFRASPASGLTGDAALPAGSGPTNAPGPAGGATQAPPGKGADVGEGTGASGTEGGATGNAGAAGKDGDPGPHGKDGDPGPAGPEGKPGDAGPKGADGKDGKDGKEGKEGDPGPAGKDGDPGPPGRQGDRGPEGPPGPACPAGFSLQVPRWDTDALVCRRVGREQPQRLPTRAAKTPGSDGASSQVQRGQPSVPAQPEVTLP